MSKIYDIIQKSEIDGMRYNKDWFISLLKDMSSDDFNRFCREMVHLRHHYDVTIGLIVSDNSGLKILHPEKCWELEEIDFDSPVNFKKIK